ncbi:hypothetical protein CEXT_41271 [Caerostris extrusa]|uniref:Uncharacterized protein n=1 Tax=Caerostris extrusa TaxID=172846 RepID=A0AAV4TZV2_CAEEX|nr:hypothetical protein CEXT_41271 [Caerostris extrusa]
MPFWVNIFVRELHHSTYTLSSTSSPSLHLLASVYASYSGNPAASKRLPPHSTECIGHLKGHVAFASTSDLHACRSGNKQIKYRICSFKLALISSCASVEFWVVHRRQNRTQHGGFLGCAQRCKCVSERTKV